MSLIKKLKVANTNIVVPAEVYPCSFEDVVAWQRLIQPYIAKTGGIGHDWNWPALFLGCTFSEQAMGRQTIVFQIRVSDAEDNAVPVIQAIASFPYKWPGGKRERCAFLWFVAATPTEALLAYGINQRFVVLAPVLDVLIQLSLSHGLQGRIGLHAALGNTDEESLDLVTRYEKQKLKRRPRKSWSFFRFPHRQEDGRLFYFDIADAAVFAATQDNLR